jgi:L-asparaginase
MRKVWSGIVPILGLLLSAGARAADKPTVKILATGGTIAGAQSDQQSYGYKSGAFKIEDLMKAVPSMEKLALASGDVDGIVITHGTDTMEETAYFLDLVVKSDKPVVLVGSMRPATAVSADGPGNLYNAVATAASPQARGRGVLVVLNDEIHSARDVTKMDTTSVETFHSPNRGAAGLVHTGKISWFEKSDKRHTSRSEFSVEGRDSLPRVDIIYAHANMSPDLIQSAIKNGAKGLVIAGVGDGNMTKEAIEVLANAAREGVVVVRSTRLPTGMVLRNNEVDDQKLGFVASGELNPAKSRVLLQLSLTKTKDPAKVQKVFEEY